MIVHTDELGVVAFVLPGRPSTAFEVHEWPDGSVSLETVEDPADVALELAYEHRHDAGLRSA